MEPVTDAVLAILSARAGDRAAARAHLEAASVGSRTAARRDRQLVEIAALVAAGDRTRAADLALEHVASFPGDDTIVALVGAADPDPHHETVIRPRGRGTARA